MESVLSEFIAQADREMAKSTLDKLARFREAHAQRLDEMMAAGELAEESSELCGLPTIDEHKTKLGNPEYHARILEYAAEVPKVEFDEVIALLAQCFRGLMEKLSDPVEFDALQEHVLEAIERWVSDRYSEVEGDSKTLAACLLTLNLKLLQRHGFGSRAIVGTVLLLVRNGTELTRLMSLHGRKRARYGFEEIVDTMSRVRNLPTIDAAKRSRLPFVDEIESWKIDRYHPALVLCCPIEYIMMHDGQIDWLRTREPSYPKFTDLRIRSLITQKGSLTRAECMRIQIDLK